VRGFGIREWGLGVWLVSGVVAVIGSVAVRVVRLAAVSSPRPRPTLAVASGPYPADSFARAAAVRDLFRVGRRPGSVAYDPSRGAAPIPDGPPKPQLAVTGIVWGEEPEAVLQGLPTSTGPRVVRVGDVVGGVTIQRIDAGRVVAVGFDTTWTLTVREPWK